MKPVTIYMYVKTFTCLCALLIITRLTAQTILPAAAKFNFNPGWKVSNGDSSAAAQPGFNDASWKNVTLPYAWNEDDAFKKDIAGLTTGIAWYRKHFTIPTEYKGQKIFLEFEGIRQAGEFYINGKYIGRHENGVMAFGFDISDVVRFGHENIIAVRTDNNWDYREKATNSKFQWEDKNFNANYGGISKNVYLHVRGRIYQTLPLFSNLGTTGIYVYANDINVSGRTATIYAEAEVKNESSQPQQVGFDVVVADLDGKIVKTFSGGLSPFAPGETRTVKASSPVTGLNFWSWGYGYLYTVQTRLTINGRAVDVVNTKTGFRKTAFNNGMIYLNDRVIMVHGYAQRTSNEWPAIGLSVPPWLSDYSNGLMVEGNGNLVRWKTVNSMDRIRAGTTGNGKRNND